MNFGGPKFGAKRDSIEPDVFKTLRAYGMVVYSTHKPLDAIVGYKGVNYLVEVKSGYKAKLQDAQIEFIGSWPGQFVVLHSVEDAEIWAKNIRGDWKSKSVNQLVGLVRRQVR